MGRDTHPLVDESSVSQSDGAAREGLVEVLDIGIVGDGFGGVRHRWLYSLSAPPGARGFSELCHV